MIEPLVRDAEPGDVPELAWLESIARDHLPGQRGGDLWLARHPAQSPRWSSVDAGEVIVGLIDGVSVGYLRFHIDDAVLYIDDVFVHPGAREVGFGDALLAGAIDRGVERGAVRIEAEALPGDRDTKNLYERAAITAKRITVSAAIGSDD